MTVRPTVPPFARAAAMLALLVLVLGLPQLLVLCRSHDEGTRLEFAQAPGACCHDHHAAPAERGPMVPGLPAAVAAPGCEHTALTIEVAPQPRPDLGNVPPAQPAIGWSPWTPAESDHDADPRQHAPATGPPHPDPRLRLIASTQLRL